jgi:hypothetical protein
VNGQSKIANKANVLFIAAARDNIPRLIAEVRRLHRQLEDTVAKDDQEVKRSTTIDYCSQRLQRRTIDISNRLTIYRSRPFTCGDVPSILLAKCAVMPRA